MNLPPLHFSGGSSGADGRTQASMGNAGWTVNVASGGAAAGGLAVPTWAWVAAAGLLAVLVLRRKG